MKQNFRESRMVFRLFRSSGKGSPSMLWSEREIEGMIFDVDGTLTDSIEAYYEVFREVTARFGIPIRKEDVLEPMATGSLIWDRIIPENVPGRDEKIRKLMEAIPQVSQEVFQHVQPFVGLASLLKRLREEGIKLGVLTSSRAVAVRPLDNHALSQYFMVIMTREDGFAPKPAPDGILECLRRLNVLPRRAIVIGDSPLDIRAGKAAGTWTIGVLSGISNLAQLDREAPTAIINDVSQLGSLLSFK